MARAVETRFLGIHSKLFHCLLPQPLRDFNLLLYNRHSTYPLMGSCEA